MENLKKSISEYFEKLNERAGNSRIYRSYQWLGLQIASLLNDFDHKALYIKLAKNGNSRRLLELAKEISANNNVRNKGAYFMSIIHKK